MRTAPELEARALFEPLLETAGEALLEGQLRSFQRGVRQWRLEHGPDPEVIFAQEQRPGEVLQVDWTHAKDLGVTIAGQPLDHRLCHVVLPYSNWQWATRCQSESLLSVRQGLQAALHRLGEVPGQLQIDNSSAATHQISAGASGSPMPSSFRWWNITGWCRGPLALGARTRTGMSRRTMAT